MSFEEKNDEDSDKMRNNNNNNSLEFEDSWSSLAAGAQFQRSCPFGCSHYRHHHHSFCSPFHSSRRHRSLHRRRHVSNLSVLFLIMPSTLLSLPLDTQSPARSAHHSCAPLSLAAGVQPRALSGSPLDQTLPFGFRFPFVWRNIWTTHFSLWLCSGYVVYIIIYALRGLC